MYCVSTHGSINTLANKFLECGIKSNGIRSQLRVTLLVNVIQPTTHSEPKNSYREAQLEELPVQSDYDDILVSEAENASSVISASLAQKLTAVDVLTHVLVCNPYKPLMQFKFQPYPNPTLVRDVIATFLVTSYERIIMASLSFIVMAYAALRPGGCLSTYYIS
ncbi:hypothetical protein COOONC_28233 [Cooperia oncophora]